MCSLSNQLETICVHCRTSCRHMFSLSNQLLTTRVHCRTSWRLHMFSLSNQLQNTRVHCRSSWRIQVFTVELVVDFMCLLSNQLQTYVFTFELDVDYMCLLSTETTGRQIGNLESYNSDKLYYFLISFNLQLLVNFSYPSVPVARRLHPRINSS